MTDSLERLSNFNLNKWREALPWLKKYLKIDNLEDLKEEPLNEVSKSSYYRISSNLGEIYLYLPEIESNITTEYFNLKQEIDENIKDIKHLEDILTKDSFLLKAPDRVINNEMEKLYQSLNKHISLMKRDAELELRINKIIRKNLAYLIQNNLV